MQWVGVITKSENISAIQSRIKYADERKISRYVMIVDLREARVGYIDIHINRLSAIADPRMISGVVLGAPQIVQVAARLLKSMVKVPVIMVATMEEAMKQAEDILRANNIT